ncbi:MAG TPA: hypothetical protein VK619_01790 [Pyrinomonadaceae bacterium]|nr:hypothetical protein [Pyrinomonadaceae bacterium]
MTHTAISRNGVTIRLNDERWTHIVEEHGELSGMRAEVLQTISNAERVMAGGAGELLAVRIVETSKALVVVYREANAAEGFIITAFLTKQLSRLNRRQQIWPSKT